MGAEFGFETGDSQLLEELLDKLEMQVGEEKGSVGQWEIPVQWAQSPLASEAPAAQGIAAACNDAGIPASILATPSTPNRTNCLNVAGVANPQQVVAQAVARAVAMLDNTIAELVKARSAICAGQVPGWPLL